MHGSHASRGFLKMLNFLPVSGSWAVRSGAVLSGLLLLAGCSGHGKDGGQGSAPPSQLLSDSYAVLGPISGATVKITDLTGKQLLSGTTETYDEARDTAINGDKRTL